MPPTSGSTPAGAPLLSAADQHAAPILAASEVCGWPRIPHDLNPDGDDSDTSSDDGYDHVEAVVLTASEASDAVNGEVQVEDWRAEDEPWEESGPQSPEVVPAPGRRVSGVSAAARQQAMRNPGTDDHDEDGRFDDTVDMVIDMAEKNQPTSTKARYEPKINEWIQWCQENGTSTLVYEKKLAHYLMTTVIPRGNRRGKKLPDGSYPALSPEGLEGYIKLVIRLYQIQKSIGKNKKSHPRAKLIKTIKNTLRRNINKNKRITYADRGAGTIQDGLSEQEMILVSEWWMDEGKRQSYRNRAMLFVGLFTVTRGNNVRDLLFSDTFYWPVKGLGPHDLIRGRSPRGCWGLGADSSSTRLLGL